MEKQQNISLLQGYSRAQNTAFQIYIQQQSIKISLLKYNCDKGVNVAAVRLLHTNARGYP